MTTNIIEIAEKTCKYAEVRVYNNEVQEVYLFSKKELTDFAREIVHECASICIEDLADPSGTVEQKCAAKIICYFGASRW